MNAEKPVYYDGSGKTLPSLNKSFIKETVIKPDSNDSLVKFPYFPYQK
ncbi:hypothetical protein ACOJQI_10535 [Bacillus salacetis]